MPFYEKGDVRLHYREEGSGPPLLIINGGGLNSRIDGGGPASIDRPNGPIDCFAEFSSQYRCIAMDLRHADGGGSTGPLDVDAPWDAYTADHLAVLDHLGVDRFMAIGFCIGNQLIWNLLKHAPDRLVAGVPAQPSFFKDVRLNLERALEIWVPPLLARRPDITEAQATAYLNKLYEGAHFVGTVSRDFIASCRTPLLVLPDDVWAHPYDMCMEMVHMAPNAQVSLYPWKDTQQNLTLALRHIHTFLKANRPPG